MPPLDAYALRSPMGGRAFALRALIGLTGAGSDSRTTWVHVAYAGEWLGHADGAFTLDDDAFRSCIAAFNTQRNPIPVDYEHSSVSDTRGEAAPAAGFIQSLELRSDGLYALVEFTPRAAEMIRGGEYRYCSGVFVFASPDRRTGEETPCVMHSLALTNSPFIDGQKPIALSARVAALSNGATMEITRDAFETALAGLEGDTFDAEQLHALVDAVYKLAEAAEPPAADESGEPAEMSDAPAEAPALTDAPPTETPAEAPALADDPAALLAQFEEVASMMGTDLAGLLAMMREQATASADAENPAALAAQVPALKATVATLSAWKQTYEAEQAAERKRLADAAERKRLADIEAEVDGHVKAGVFRLADKPKFIKLARRSLEDYREIVGALAPAVKFGVEAATTPVAPSGAEALDMNDENVRALANQLRGYGLSEERIKARLTDHFTGRVQTRSAAG